VQQTSGALGNLQTQLAGQYQGLLQDPTSSPLYQGQLGGLLKSLLPSEDRARTNLTDTFRATGGLRSGAYGREAGNLENDILGQREQTAQRLLGQVFPQLMQALQQPMGQIPSLIDALKLSQSQGAANYSGNGASSSGWDQISKSLGLATPMQSDSLSLSQMPTYGGSTQVGVNAPMQRQPSATTPAPAPYTPYLDPWSPVQGNSIAQNPYTGYYETVPPPQTNPYEHTYGEWTTQMPEPGEYY